MTRKERGEKKEHGGSQVTREEASTVTTGTLVGQEQMLMLM